MAPIGALCRLRDAPMLGCLMQSAKMPPKRAKPANPDDTMIDVDQGYEVDYWCRVLRCTERQLRDAARVVGPKVGNIRRRLSR